MTILADDQKQAVKEITTWWNSSRAFHILDGSGGVGKTFVIEKILKALPRVKPILLAPTHKALGQLRAKTTKGDYQYRTVANALGMRPVDEGKELEFIHTKMPSFWGEINLAVVDEGSMLSEIQLQLFETLGKKILYVGHKSQLPPVKKNRSVYDKCISPVFDRDYTSSHLWIPKRNVGKLWDYNNYLETRIYDTTLAELPDYDITGKALADYVHEEQILFSSGKTKFALWTNDGVAKYNARLRKVIFGYASQEEYLPDDLVICTNTFTELHGLEHLNQRQVLELETHSRDIYTDTDGRVTNVSSVVVKLNAALHIECWKLIVETEVEGETYMYVMKHRVDYKRVADFYEHIAWGRSTKQAKDKAYRERAIILRCFAQVKHFYAATCHRLQGSSIPNVIVIQSDINKNSNKIERAKCTYVAASRSIDNLMVYRGL